jgi:hypothetical protein
MTHRIDHIQDEQGDRLVFQGHLDRRALEELARVCRASFRVGEPLRVVLGAGTLVDAGLVDDLFEIPGIELAAEPPFLARLIANRSECTRKG